MAMMEPGPEPWTWWSPSRLPRPAAAVVAAAAASAGPSCRSRRWSRGRRPAGLSFGFTYACANALGTPVLSRPFTGDAGREWATTIAAGLSCTLTVTDDGGATDVDGLFMDVVIPPAGYKTTVTFTFGPVPSAVSLDQETVIEEAGVSLTIPAGSRDAPYAVLLETGGENCERDLELDGESLACHTVTVFDADGEEEPDVTLLVPATITITLDAARVEELGGIEGVRAARERGELRMLQRDDADSPWRELPFTVQETDDGGVQIVLTVQTFSDFALITSEPRLRDVPLHAGWNVVAWDGADGAGIADALGDVAGQVDVIYQWVAETQTWRSHRPGAPPARSAFDQLHPRCDVLDPRRRGGRMDGRRGADRAAGRRSPPPAPPLDRSRLAGGGRGRHRRGVRCRRPRAGRGGVSLGRRDADLAQLPPGRPQRLRHLPDGRQLLDRRDGGGGVDSRRRTTGLTGGSDPSGN